MYQTQDIFLKIYKKKKKQNDYEKERERWRNSDTQLQRKTD